MTTSADQSVVRSVGRSFNPARARKPVSGLVSRVSRISRMRVSVSKDFSKNALQAPEVSGYANASTTSESFFSFNSKIRQNEPTNLYVVSHKIANSQKVRKLMDQDIGRKVLDDNSNIRGQLAAKETCGANFLGTAVD